MEGGCFRGEFGHRRLRWPKISTHDHDIALWCRLQMNALMQDTVRTVELLRFLLARSQFRYEAGKSPALTGQEGKGSDHTPRRSLTAIGQWRRNRHECLLSW